MLRMFGERQQQLLRALHKSKRGMTIDELAKELGITRTAVKQHLVALEQAGFVEKGSVRLTRGRPSRAFRLSNQGSDLFPKQYSWFSGLLLRALKAERGSEGLINHLRELANSVVHIVSPRLKGLEGKDRVQEIAKIMNELSYEAELDSSIPSDDMPPIQAHNCVYHHLAQEFPEVCEFDRELLSRLSQAEVIHQECIIRGGNVCRFAFRR